jgi:ketosteroid isomerase-like protein
MKSMPLVLFLIALGAACQPAAPPVDLEAVKTSLMDADKAWSETPAQSVEAFVAYFAEGASFFPPSAPKQAGREAITAFVTQLFSLPGVKVEWTAESAEVASSGDMGYTQGSARLTINDASGNPVTDTMKYVTVWKKAADGSWKVVADIFNSDNPPPAGAPQTP